METIVVRRFGEIAALDDLAVRGAGLELPAMLLEELAHGVVLLGSGAQIVHANVLARQELSRGRMLANHDGVLHVCHPEEAKLLQEALGKVCEGKRGLVTLTAEDATLAVAVVPVRGEMVSLPVRAALFFSRASVCESQMLGFFAREHGLTGAEAQVLGILCHGYSTPEIARQLKVAVSTVRSHVRSLCAKTRSSGVRTLVSRVAVLPPVAPSLREHVH